MATTTTTSKEAPQESTAEAEAAVPAGQPAEVQRSEGAPQQPPSDGTPGEAAGSTHAGSMPAASHPRIGRDSPISNENLEKVADLVNRRFKRARKRLPKEVRKRALDTLATLYAVVQTPVDAERWPVTRRKRIELARELEELAAELLGTTAFSPGFYAEGRLAVIRAFDPVRISGSIQPAKVEAHFVRYEDRARRAIARLNWFLERCGVEPEPKDEDEIPPWEKPYGRLDAYKELLWGTPRRKVPQPR